MSGFFEACGAGTVAGAVLGGMTGFALSIWVAVDFVEPAFESIDGISPPGAKGITAAIALLGGIEAFIGLGSCVGALVGAILTPPIIGIASCCCDVGNNNSSFFSNQKSNQPRALPTNVSKEAPMAITVNQV